MNYFISAPILESNPKLPLTREEFQALKQSRICLNAAFALEEIYDSLLSNYRELELEALSATVDEMTSNKSEYSEHFEVRTGLNRRTLNLLSSARLYLDQYQQWLKELGVDPELAKNKACEAYDTHFEYRFMESLRNHVQHVGHAVHGVTYNAHWQPPSEAEYLEFTIVPYAMKSELVQDAKFKKVVLNECPDTIPILPAARTYVGGISSIHKMARESAEPLVSSARMTIENIIARHEAAAGQKYSVLAAVAKQGNILSEKITIILKWDDVRLKLIAKNNPIINLAKRTLSYRG